MATGYDVSVVAPQGAYIASHFPVRALRDVVLPCEPRPGAERRVERGRSFEAEVIAKLPVLHRRATEIAVGDSKERELATLGAMRKVCWFFGGRLPTDLDGRRVGEPDLLLRVPGSPSYRCIEIKARQTPDVTLGRVEATCSDLASPGPEAAEGRPGRWARLQ